MVGMRAVEPYAPAALMSSEMPQTAFASPSAWPPRPPAKFITARTLAGLREANASEAHPPVDTPTTIVCAGATKSCPFM